MASKLKVEDIADADIDDTQEALIPPLKLSLVENLNGDDG